MEVGSGGVGMRRDAQAVKQALDRTQQKKETLSKPRQQPAEGGFLDKVAWNKRKGISTAVSETLQTFQVDKLVRSELNNPFKDTGFSLMDTGVTKGIKLANQNTDKKVLQREDTDLLERWKKGQTSKRRGIVTDMSKTAGQRATEERRRQGGLEFDGTA